MSNGSKRASREFTAAGEFRAYVENNLSGQNNDVHPHAGMVSGGSAQELLSMFEAYYDGSNPEMPHHFRETSLGSLLRKAYGTRKATKAVEQGNISQIKYFTGKQDYSNDVSGLHTLRKLRNFLQQPAYIAYMYGHMGNGKTDFALLCAEVAAKELDVEIASNIKSWEEKDQYVYSYGDLLQWLAEGHEVEEIDDIKNLDVDVTDKLFVFDEASSHASGYSQDAYETQKKLGTLVKKIRKVGGSMLIIGHTGKDIHPDIRRVANDCIEKVSKKTAEYYKSVDEGEGKGHKFTISGIPQTNYTYDTNEITDWDWSKQTTEEMKKAGDSIKEERMSTEERNMEIARLYVENDNMTYEKIVRELDLSISPRRVGQILTQMARESEEMQVENV